MTETEQTGAAAPLGTGLLFFDDRRQLRDCVVRRREDGASWKEIQREVSPDFSRRYYIYYLKGITPRRVGGSAPEGFDPDPPQEEGMG